MEIKGLLGVMFFLNFSISSVQTCNCASTAEKSEKSSDGKLEVIYKLGGKSPETVQEACTKGFLKAVEKVATDSATAVIDGITESPLRGFTTRYAAVLSYMRHYAQFGIRSKVVQHETIERLKELLNKVLTHAQKNDCNCEDYVVIAERVQECGQYIRNILQESYIECMPKKGKRPRSLLQRLVGLVTTPYDTRAMSCIIKWMITDLEELEQRSDYKKGFDVDHYKKVICYLQADLDTLFNQLEALI